MSEYLLIGPVLLEAFELPSRVGWGGRQRLAVHRLPGGRRVIDAMGRDDADVVWAGVFTGEDAVFRARAVDLMRAGGLVWPLSWGSFFYTVVVGRFEADYTRENWIPYRIACTVLRDEAAGLAEDALSLAGGVLADLAGLQGADFAALEGVVDAVGLAALAAAPGALRGGTAAHGATVAGLRTQQAALDQATAARGVRLRAADTDTADGMLAARDDAGALAVLARARGPLGRARAGAEAAS
ncbi:MAG: hypothetical protein IT555_05730 [Acetobacteraceae bacterium]|nr:hypothetical protein [Acetobacteraceae bacterium]